MAHLIITVTVAGRVETQVGSLSPKSLGLCAQRYARRPLIDNLKPTGCYRS